MLEVTDFSGVFRALNLTHTFKNGWIVSESLGDGLQNTILEIGNKKLTVGNVEVMVFDSNKNNVTSKFFKTLDIVAGYISIEELAQILVKISQQE